MARLTSKQRKGLKSSTFGLPAERKYPMPDASHARVAKSYASKEANRGLLSLGQKSQIDRKADRIIGKGRKK